MNKKGLVFLVLASILVHSNLSALRIKVVNNSTNIGIKGVYLTTDKNTVQNNKGKGGKGIKPGEDHTFNSWIGMSAKAVKIEMRRFYMENNLPVIKDEEFEATFPLLKHPFWKVVVYDDKIELYSMWTKGSDFAGAMQHIYGISVGPHEKDDNKWPLRRTFYF